MFDLKNYALAGIVSIAWWFGAQSLWDVVQNFSTQWYWYVLATLYCVTINEIFLHQLCTHSSIKVNPQRWTYKVLVFLTSVDNAYGPLTSFCLLHKNHHLYADKDQDLVNYRTTWHSACLLSPWVFFMDFSLNMPNKEKYLASQNQQYSSLINDTWTQICERNRIALTLIYWAILWVVFPIFLFKVVFMGRFLLSIFKIFGDIFGHMKLPLSYRNYNTNDTSYNHLIFHYLSLCLLIAMLHNNHHGMLENQERQARWFEFDLSRVIMHRLLKPLLV